MKAIQEGYQVFTINNPPLNDPEFELLMHRIKDQRRFLYNGKEIEVPKNLILKTQHLPDEIKLDRVRVTNELDKNETRELIYLDLNNWHECFERLRMSGGKALSEAGFLEMFDPTKHVFYITDSIPYSDWQILLDYIRENFKDEKKKDFEFILAPGASIEKVAVNHTPVETVTVSLHSALKYPSSCNKINDPDFFTDLLNTKYSGSIAIHMTPETTLNQLLFNMQIVSKEEDPSKVNFKCEPQGMLEALKNGQTVFLNGDISETLYKQLLPLISNAPGYIYMNGERIEIKGTLILVLPETSKLKPLKSVQTHLTLEDYQSSFKDQEKIFLNLKKFSDLAQKYPARGMGRPEFSQFTHTRLQRMIHAIEKRQLHPHNPIKGLFHFDYPKDSSDYAYLNVVAKYLFCADDEIHVREDKLRQLLAHLNIQNISDLENEQAWQILNCFRGRDLQTLLGPDINEAILMNRGFPSLNTEVQTRLLAKIKPFLPSSKEEKDKPKVPVQDPTAKQKKQQDQLRILLDDPDTPFILLKGPPGVGKSVTVRALKDKLNFDYYEGEDGILKWLTNESANTKVLLLDEANMASPGTWDFLKGLRQNQKKVYYKGKFYKLSEKHKIIATGNPESFSGRYYHSFFQNYAETLLFKKPSDDYLENILLKNLLEPEKWFKPEYCQKLFSAYKLIQKYNPSFVYSIRDLENLSQRFITLVNKNPSESKEQILWEACLGEFAGSIFDVKARQLFIDELSEKLKYSPNLAQKEGNGVIPFLNSDPPYFLPEEKRYILDGVEQDLLLRTRMIDYAEEQSKKEEKGENKKPDLYYKQGVLIEGDPGVGKSRMLKEILEKNGFKKDSKDTQKKYYEISAGPSKVVEDKLLRAFHEGAIVILDEINLDKSLEKLLNQLLTDKDLFGNNATKKGFMVFSSQNPASYQGRKSMSPALRNRLHAFYIEPYSKKALIDMARAHKLDDPEGFVNAYLRRAAHSKRPANMRTFFTQLEKESKIKRDRQSPSLR